MSKLYDTDFAAWAQSNARLLREGRLAEADTENIAWELEGLAGKDLRELQSRLMRIVEHELKLSTGDPSMRERNERLWRRAIARQEFEIEKLLQYSPSLASKVDEAMLMECYTRAVRLVSLEFPGSVKYTATVQNRELARRLKAQLAKYLKVEQR